MKDEIMEKLLLSGDMDDNRIGVTLWTKKYGARSLWEHTRALGIEGYYWYRSGTVAVLLREFLGENERPVYIKIYTRGVEPEKYKSVYYDKRNYR